MSNDIPKPETAPQTGLQTKRATTRPAHVKAPAHWSKTDAPKPDPADSKPDLEPLDPVRYGDWERNGVAVDF